MLTCPNCKVPLVKVNASPGVFWRCGSCDGRSATLPLLRRSIPAGVLNALWQSARTGACDRKRLCPACGNPMAEVPACTPGGTQHLDVCTVCQFIWFDCCEYSALPLKPRRTDWKENLPQAAREKLALLEIEATRERMEADDMGATGPDAWWQWIPGVLGMPVEHNAYTVSSLPWVTWGTAALIAAVSVAAFSDLETAVANFGLVPAQFGRLHGLTFLSSFLIHGGVLHLIGNLYFLLIFGDNVEEWLGRWRFLSLLAGAALLGAVVHILGDPHSTTPCVGASGGISGVMAFYALQFPKARLGLLLRFYLYVRWIRLPAAVLFIGWLVLQGWGTWMQRAGVSNVSSLAHLGGAGVGVAFWLALKFSPRCSRDRDSEAER